MMKKYIKYLLIMFLLLSLNTINVFAVSLSSGWKSVCKSEEKGVYNGHDWKIYEGTAIKTKNDKIYVEMYNGSDNAWASNSWTEYYWDWELKKDGSRKQGPYRINLGGCNPKFGPFTDESDSIDFDVSNLSSGVYTIKGNAPDSARNSCNLEVRTDGFNFIINDYIDFNYTISYSCNGGIGYVPSQTAEQGQSIRLNENGCSYIGYTYKNWNKNSAGTGTNYNPGDYVSFSNDVTMYAKWEANKYKLTLNPNGGMIGNSI